MNPLERITQLETEIKQYQAMETYLYARIQKLEKEIKENVVEGRQKRLEKQV